MSEFEELKKQFVSMGIEFDVEIDVGGDNQGIRLFCREGNVKVKGYNCFYTVFKFNQEGELIEMGAYE